MVWNKRSEEEVKNIINDSGYELLENYYLKDDSRHRRVVIRDNIGYIYDVVLDEILRKSKIHFVDVSNPYTLKNISLWIKLNNKDFILIDGCIYSGAFSKLMFHCNKCSENFDMNWASISVGKSCPYCSGKRIGKNNNLKYVFPELAKEWDYNKNDDIPDNISPWSNKKAWWKCKICGHSWLAVINSRADMKRGCPACCGQAVSDKNRLSILYPEILLEWDYSKNGDLVPSNFSYGSKEEVWWKCSVCGKEWKNTIRSRTLDKNNLVGCPNCASSKGEKRTSKYLNNNNFYFIDQHKFPDCRNKRMLPFYFYLPNKNICIEYDGILHYEDKFNSPKDFKATKKNDKIKTKYCKDNGIKLIRIPYWDFDNIETILEKELFK